MPNWKENYSRYKGFYLNIVELYKKRSEIKIFLEFILTVISLVVFSVFALKPTIATIVELLKEIDAKEDTIAKMDEKIKNLVTAQTNLSRERESILILEESIPQYPYPEKAMGQFVGLAAEKQINLSSASVGDTLLKGGLTKSKSSSQDLEKLPDNVNSFEVSLGFEGTFESLMDGLSYVEKMRRPIKIDSVKMSKKVSEETLVNLINVNITGRVPFLNITKELKNEE